MDCLKGFLLIDLTISVVLSLYCILNIGFTVKLNIRHVVFLSRQIELKASTSQLTTRGYPCSSNKTKILEQVPDHHLRETVQKTAVYSSPGITK